MAGGPGWWILLGLLLQGCSAKFGGPAARVKRFSVEGNGGLFQGRSDTAVLSAMAHPRPRGVWPFKKKIELDRLTLEEDRLRIENWYANRGFFDASLIRWEVEEVRKGRNAKPPVVKVKAVVVEKERSRVASVAWVGLDGVAPPLARNIQRQAPLREDRPFDIDDYTETLALTTTSLENQSFAYAEVKGRIEVTPSRHQVDVRLAVDPGPPSEFGEVDIRGSRNVPEWMIRDKVIPEPGTPYRMADLESTQRRLYGMEVFSVVEVVPELESGSTTIPVDIRLKEREPREFRMGGGSQISSGRQEALASVRFEHNNLFHRVWSFDLRTEGGYAIVGADLADGIPTSGVRGGPVADVTAILGAPHVPVNGWRGALEGKLEMNIEEAYRYISPSIEPSITGTLGTKWTLSLAYELRYQRYLDLQIDPSEIEELAIAPDLVDEEYLNTALKQTILWDTRNDVLRPSSGGQRSLTFIEAGHYLGGDFDYVGALADLRAYQSVRRIFPRAPPLLILAGRLGGGWLVPYGSEERAHVPYGERLTLGGSNSVRGWVADHLGPYVCSTDSGETCSSAPGEPQPEADTVPIGGLLSAYGSFEVRKYWKKVGAVAFVDFGMVWEGQDQLGEIPLLPAVGPGFRYQTPVGALRLDVAVRTDDLEMYRNEPRLWFHLGLGEAY